MSNIGRVLENLSQTLPSHASLHAALNPQMSLSQSLTLTTGANSQSASMGKLAVYTQPRRGGLANYYERRIGSSQGSRGRAIRSSSYSYGSANLGAPATTASTASAPSAMPSAAFSNIQYLNALMGKGVGAAAASSSSTGRPSPLVLQTSRSGGVAAAAVSTAAVAAASSGNDGQRDSGDRGRSNSSGSGAVGGAHVSHQAYSEETPGGKPGVVVASIPVHTMKGGLSLSPIQVKKKSVRWSDSLENYDSADRGKGEAQRGPTWSKVVSGDSGEKSSVVLKSVLVVHASNNNNVSSSSSSSARMSAAPAPPDPTQQVRPSTTMTYFSGKSGLLPVPTSALTRDFSSSSGNPAAAGKSFMDLASMGLLAANPGLSKGAPLPSLKAPLAGKRPSLSDQLASIGAKADALTADIKTKAGMSTDGIGGSNDVPIFVVPSKCLSVGTLNCRFPSPARFFRDRIEYTFHHPFESTEVEMVMFYRLVFPCYPLCKTGNRPEGVLPRPYCLATHSRNLYIVSPFSQRHGADSHAGRSNEVQAAAKAPALCP